MPGPPFDGGTPPELLSAAGSAEAAGSPAGGATAPYWYRDPQTPPVPTPQEMLQAAIAAGAQFTEVEVPLLEGIQPSPDMVKAGSEYVANWMAYSNEIVKSKLPDYKLFEDLLHNARTLDDFGTTSRSRLYEIVPAAKRVAAVLDQTKSWRSKQVIAVSPVVDSYVERLHQTTFSQPDYFAVTPHPRSSAPTIEDQKHSTSDKLQRLAIKTSDDMQFASAVEQLFRDALVFRYGVAKCSWWDDAQWVKVFLRDAQGNIYPKPSAEDPNQQEVRRKIYRQGVQVKRVRLNNFLPDPHAESPDIDLWSGIADKTIVPYLDILEEFKTPDNPEGIYNVNLDEFMERWPNEESADIIDPTGSNELEIGKSDEAENAIERSPIRALRVWEWHGKLRFDQYPEPVESVVSIVTGVDAETPRNGICIRMQLKPVLENRRRPYIFHPHGPMPWVGIIEQNLDLIWNLSHAICLFVDACRICSIPLVAADETSSIFDESDDVNLADIIFPGKLFKVRGPNSIQAFSITAGDLASILNYINMCKAEWRERTAVSEITRGVEGQKKTATESTYLFQQSQESLGTKLSRIRDCVMRPYGQIMLCMFKQYIKEDQEFPMDGANGTPEPAVLSVEEITTGEYDIEPVFDLPQEAKISRANNIIQMYAPLQQLEATLLLRFRKVIRWDNLVEAPAKLLGIMDSCNIIDEANDQDIQNYLVMNSPPPPPGQETAPGADGQGQPNPEGGPNGPEPSTANEAAFEAQASAAQAGPVPIGGQGPA